MKFVSTFYIAETNAGFQWHVERNTLIFESKFHFFIYVHFVNLDHSTLCKAKQDSLDIYLSHLNITKYKILKDFTIQFDNQILTQTTTTTTATNKTIRNQSFGCLNAFCIVKLLSKAVQYSKNPQKRTSGLRTLRPKFGQQSTIYKRINSAWQMKKFIKLVRIVDSG